VAGSDVEVAAAATGDITRRDPQRAAGASVLSLPVQFAFDSAEILPAARAQLDALAEGVRMLPPTTRVVIEGHTDAAGRDDYNQQLSLRRAQSVKRYLVAAHGVEPDRLRAVGLGEYAPLVGLAPTAPENRRVQFRGER
jgi:outer membrane protein OmpA-like peptidoglycan-associated protein